MRKVAATVLLLALLALPLVSCLSERSTGIAEPEAVCNLSVQALKEGGSFVPIRGFEFLVDTLRVSAGARVTWVNCEAVSADPHTVTSDNGVWNSPLVAVGASFTRTFDVRGTFPYHCTPHPHMRAVVIVQ